MALFKLSTIQQQC